VRPVPVRLLATSGVAALALTVATTSVAAAAPTAAAAAPVTGGHTTIALAPKTLDAIHSHGMTLSAIGPATLKNKNLRLPISSGTATPPNYVITYKGGFKVTKGGTTVKVTHITIDTAKHTGTANVTNHGRIVALTIGDPNRGNGGPGMVQFGGFKVTLSAAGYKALDNVLSTMVFKNHPKLGVGSTTVKFAT
jgi:hypothetical protein